MPEEYLKRRRELKEKVAERYGRPITHFVWRNGILYFEDGTDRGGQPVPRVPAVPKPANGHLSCTEMRSLADVVRERGYDALDVLEAELLLEHLEECDECNRAVREGGAT